jgi:predicted deacylase
MEQRLDSILSLQLPYREALTIQQRVYRGGDGPRVAVVAGLHGDELEGLYTCHRLAAWLETLAEQSPDALHGQVELYPGLNPLGLDTLQRTVPVYDSDLNRSFPGHPDGLLPQRIAAALMAQLAGAVLVIDVHASNIYLREIPQVRLDQRFQAALLPLAQRLNVELVWVQGSQRVAETSLSHCLNARGVPCLLVEMGVGMELTPRYTEQLLAGILRLWQELGVLSPELALSPVEQRPLVVTDGGVHNLNADTSGLFVALVDEQTRTVAAGEPLGLIVSPFSGRPLAEIRAPVAGTLFTLRHYPLAYEGSLLARIAVPTNLE